MSELGEGNKKWAYFASRMMMHEEEEKEYKYV